MTDFAPGSTGLLAPLKEWLQDDQVREISINYPGEVFVERKGFFTRYCLPILGERWLRTLGRLLANESQQAFDEQHPLLSAQMLDGSRIYAILPPIARYPLLTIRRQISMKPTLKSYCHIGQRSFQKVKASEHAYKIAEKLTQDSQLLTLYQSKNWQEFIKLAVLNHKNIVISGATACGKTSFLNACLLEIPMDERLVILEDVRELQPPHANKIQLLAFEQDGGVSMQTLLRSALRLRPDRIIMGEIRGQEVADFISACLTGHRGSMASIHAGSPKQALLRMAQLYRQNSAMVGLNERSIQQLLHTAVDIIIQLFRRGNRYDIASVYYREAG